MTAMSQLEAAFCRSAPWRRIARHVLLPWAVRDRGLRGHVLEIGAGSGAMADEMLRRYPEIGRLCAVDVDHDMVASARTRLARHGDRAATRAVDANTIPFEDDSFDAVCSWLMLHHTGSWQRVTAEVARVLRPGGSFLGYDLADTRAARLIHHTTRSDVNLLDPARFERELHARDFIDISVDTTAVGHLFRFAGLCPTATTGTMTEE